MDLRSNPAVFIGGGSILYREYLENSPMVASATFIENPKANAVGYFIENEGGGTVAHFDSLCTAALVLRYLNGAPMTEEDADMAWDAMQAFDTRNEGKRH